jgi:alpha-glucosidase
MDRRRDFTTDPDRYPQKKMKELVDTLHERQQRYVLILDPGVLASDPDYEPYKSGHEKGVFLKYDTSVSDQDYLGAQWAGIAAWPDWFANSTQDWWTDEILKTFDSETGVGIDGVWVDMNEASNFCQNRNCNLTQQGIDNPPAPTAAPRPGSPRPISGFPADFQPGTKARRSTSVQSRQSQSGTGQHLGLPDRDFFTPKFHINNAKGGLSDYTLYTNLTNADGSKQYDTHNFYGHMMSHTTQASMLQRRPGLRPFVLTRSTFAGTGRKVAHWFGDNESSWEHYRTSIRQMLAFVSMHQMPMVGSDVCGFNSNADQYMCARWALLGAFQPFYRNHAERSTIPQEFYQWPITIEAGTKAVNTRYKLIDYAYTALYYQTTEGTPMINPLFFLYPTDANTFAIQEQWFFGDALLISPVTADYSDTVTFYLPKDTFYDYWTHELVEGLGANVTRSNVSWTDIPVHIRGGTIIPERANSSNTTAMLRREDFVLLIAPDSKGMAKGRLYLDDGESIDQQGKISEIAFAYDNGKFTASGSMAYMADGAQNQGESLTVNKVVILGQTSAPANGTNFKYNSASKEVQVTGPWKFTGGTWSFDINGAKPRYGAPRKY